MRRNRHATRLRRMLKLNMGTYVMYLYPTVAPQRSKDLPRRNRW
jgi:hypothetical protein